MKKFFNKVSEKCNMLAIRAKCAIENVKAEGYDEVYQAHRIQEVRR